MCTAALAVGLLGLGCLALFIAIDARDEGRPADACILALAGCALLVLGGLFWRAV